MSGDPRNIEDVRLRAAVESAPSGLLMVDPEGRIVLVNREVERLFGYPREELLGRQVELLVPDAARDVHLGFREEFLANPSVRAMGAGRDLHGLRKDGSKVPVEIGLTPVVTSEGMFVLSSVVDISRRKEAEEAREQLEGRLRQSQKMEAVGRLAGGIAHDFNNILGAIQGYAELLEPELDSAAGREDLTELLGFVARGKALVERIQRFGGRSEAPRAPVALEQTVNEVARFLRSSLGPDIEIVAAVDEKTPRVFADPTGMHQVLMNLGMNAAHAMPKGGRIEFRLAPFYLTDSGARSRPTLREGLHVLVTVADSGDGIPADLQSRVFEPFFTT